METTGNTYFYSNKMGRIIFKAAAEIIGQHGVNAILNLAELPEYINQYPPNNQKLEFPFEHICRFQRALEEYYGPRGGQGVALRIGRASFEHGLREFGPLPGLTDMAFRLLPLGTRLQTGATAFANFFNKYTDQVVRLEDTGKILYWHIERCPLCWEREDSSPVCQMAVGLLQEGLYWVSGGKYFNVEETDCIAKGDPACTIMIDKVPMS